MYIIRIYMRIYTYAYSLFPRDLSCATICLQIRKKEYASSICMFVYVFVLIHECIYVHVCVYINVCMYTTCSTAYLCVCVYMLTYVYTFAYTHNVAYVTLVCRSKKKVIEHMHVPMDVYMRMYYSLCRILSVEPAREHKN
jgi:hypothetical protein